AASTCEPLRVDPEQLRPAPVASCRSCSCVCSRGKGLPRYRLEARKSCFVTFDSSRPIAPEAAESAHSTSSKAPLPRESAHSKSSKALVPWESVHSRTSKALVLRESVHSTSSKALIPRGSARSSESEAAQSGSGDGFRGEDPAREGIGAGKTARSVAARLERGYDVVAHAKRREFLFPAHLIVDDD